MGNYYGYNIDIDFCIDASEGLETNLSEIRFSVVTIINYVFKYMDKNHQNLNGFRGRLVLSGDYSEDENEIIKRSEFYNLVEDIDEFMRLFDNTKSKEEYRERGIIDSLACTIKFDWCSGNRMRQIVVIYSVGSEKALNDVSCYQQNYYDGQNRWDKTAHFIIDGDRWPLEIEYEKLIDGIFEQ